MLNKGKEVEAKVMAFAKFRQGAQANNVPSRLIWNPLCKITVEDSNEENPQSCLLWGPCFLSPMLLLDLFIVPLSLESEREAVGAPISRIKHSLKHDIGALSPASQWLCLIMCLCQGLALLSDTQQVNKCWTRHTQPQPPKPDHLS